MKILLIVLVYIRLLFLCNGHKDSSFDQVAMPMSFRKFFKRCAVIIDCSEVFMERPSDLLARTQVWSNYKHHSTLKFMIGITPQGTISYVSSCVGGRMSDKEIVSLLNYLLPGIITNDIVLNSK